MAGSLSLLVIQSSRREGSRENSFFSNSIAYFSEKPFSSAGETLLLSQSDRVLDSFFEMKTLKNQITRKRKAICKGRTLYLSIVVYRHEPKTVILHSSDTSTALLPLRTSTQNTLLFLSHIASVVASSSHYELESSPQQGPSRNVDDFLMAGLSVEATAEERLS